MKIKRDLFLATLSLDSYNQGYGKRIDHKGKTIGDAVFKIDSELIFSDPTADPEAISRGEAVGFYAATYDTPHGLVISYRGTDDPSIDVWTGWVTALGVLGPQAQLAAEFYHTVKNDEAYQGKHIILTGHSLGGALAGFTSANAGWASAHIF